MSQPPPTVRQDSPQSAWGRRWVGDSHDEARKEFLEARGETAQVFALPTDGTQELLYLEQGAAEVVRERAKAGQLIGPIPDCPEPALTTVGGTRRHHFRHSTRV